MAPRVPPPPATDGEAHSQVRLYEAASSANGPAKNGWTGETGNWAGGGAFVLPRGRYPGKEREPFPLRPPRPDAKCWSSEPEDAGCAVFFTDSLFGLGNPRRQREVQGMPHTWC